MQFIHMNGSVFIWISLDGSFNSLNLAMPSRFVTQLNHSLLIFRITFRLEQLYLVILVILLGKRSLSEFVLVFSIHLTFQRKKRECNVL
jgi:hypothetical protein